MCERYFCTNREIPARKRLWKSTLLILEAGSVRMAVSREQSQYGRRRSNTAQSTYRPVPVPVTAPLKIGDTRILNAWVHDVKDSPSVVFNHSWWPGVQEGDCLRVSSSNSENPEAAFLFTVPKEEVCSKPQLQVCHLPEVVFITFTMCYLHDRYLFYDQSPMYLDCATTVKLY